MVSRIIGEGDVLGTGNFSSHIPKPYGGAQQATQKKKKNFWEDNISTGGSLGGALGGGAIGTAILPGVGTLIGALLGGAAGGAGGQVAENKYVGDNLDKDVLSEALWGGATALPFGASLKLAKAGGTLAKGAGSTAARQGAMDLVQEAGVKTMSRGAVGKLSLSDALRDAPAKAAAERLAAQPTLSQKLGGRLSGAADDLAIKQFRLSPSQINGLKPVLKEDPGAFIRKNGFTSLEDITTKGIDPLQSEYDKVISSMKAIPKESVKAGFDDYIKPLKSSVSLDDRALAQKLQIQANEVLKSLGDNVSGEQVLKLRRQFDSAVKRNAYGSAEMNMNKGTADALRAGLQSSADTLGMTAADGRSLKQVGKDLSKLRTLEEVVAKQSEVGRGSLPAGLNLVTGAVLGGSGGGIGGALAGAAGQAVVNSPFSRRAMMSVADKAVSKLSSKGPNELGQALKQTALRVGGVGATRGVLNGQSSFEENSATAPKNSIDSMNMPISSNMGESYQNNEQMSSEPSIGGYTKSQIENAMAAAITDGNSKAYTQLQSLYDLLPQGSALSSAAGTQVASNANATNTLSQLEGLYGTSGGGLGKIGGSLQNALAGAGMNGDVQTYNDLAASSVSQLARALNGGGQVSDADAAVVIQALPKVTDSPEVAARKFAALKDRLQNAMQNTLTFSGGAAAEPTQQLY